MRSPSAHRRPAVSGGLCLVLALLLAGAGNMGFHVLVSRLMGPSEYGVFGSLLALMVLVTVPTAGFQTIITARVARALAAGRAVDVSALHQRFIRAGLCCAAVALAVSPPLRAFLRIESPWPLLWLAAYCLLPLSIVVPWGWLCGHGRLATVGGIVAVSTLVRIGVGTLLIVSGLGVSGAIAASVVADTCQAAALLIASGRVAASTRPSVAPGAVAVAVDLRASLTGVAAFAGLWLLAGTDTIVARHLFDPVVAGRYSATATTLHGALYVSQALAAALLPSFATASPRRARGLLLQALAGTMIMIVPVMVALTVLGPRLLPRVFGPAFVVAPDVTALIAAATVGLALLWVLVQQAIASSRPGANLVWLGLPVMAVGAARWHAEAATLATVGAVAVAVPLALLASSALRGTATPARSGQGRPPPALGTPNVRGGHTGEERAMRLLRYPAWRRERWDMLAALERDPVPSECSVCGQAGRFRVRPVVGPRLASQWELSRAQRVAIDIQQGHTCSGCGNNLRGRSLADALTRLLGAGGPLTTALDRAGPVSVLEVNPAARLTPVLDRAARHVCTSFPEVDMQHLPYGTGDFDFVVHSDTLEHVPCPVQGIRECLRVASGGWVVFTTPILFDRLTRDRSRMPASFHGGDSGRSLVHWEFGADIGSLLSSAGATEMDITSHGHPYSCAVVCRGTAVSPDRAPWARSR